MSRLEFAVRGSKGDIYKITFEASGGKVTAFCSCKATQFCKHLSALVDGDPTALVSSNEAQLNDLKALLHNSDLEKEYIGVVEAERTAEAADQALRVAKKALATKLWQNGTR